MAIAVSAVALIIALATLLLTFRKESVALRKEELQLRVRLVTEMASAVAEVVGASRHYMATHSAPNPAPDFRIARNAFFIRTAGITVQLRSYVTGPSDPQELLIDRWVDLEQKVRRYNLMCGAHEPRRLEFADQIADFVAQAPLVERMPDSWASDFKSLQGPAFSTAYFFVGQCLLERVYPLSRQIVEAPRSRAFGLVQPRK